MINPPIETIIWLTQLTKRLTMRKPRQLCTHLPLEELYETYEERMQRQYEQQLEFMRMKYQKSYQELLDQEIKRINPKEELPSDWEEWLVPTLEEIKKEENKFFNLKK